MSLFSFGLGATGTGGGGETVYLYPEHSLTFEQEDTTVQFVESAYAVSYDDDYEIDVVVYDEGDNVSSENSDTVTHVTS